MKKASETQDISFLVFFSLFTIVLYGGWGWKGLPESLPNIMRILGGATALVLSTIALFGNKVNALYFKEVKWICAVMLISSFIGFVFGEVSFYYTIRGVIITLGCYMLFFYLWKKKPKVEILENYILIFGIIYIILWLYAISVAPIPVFGTSEEEVSDNRGFFRVNLVGIANLVLSFFICLNQFIKRKSVKYFMLAMVFASFILLQLMRQIIFFSLLIGIIYIVISYKKIGVRNLLFVILVFIFGGIVLYLNYGEYSTMLTLVDMTQDQLSGQLYTDKDPRLIEYEYFFTAENYNPLFVLFGHGDNILHLEYLGKNYEIWDSDVGWARIYYTTGLLGLITMFLLFVKPSIHKTDSNLEWARLFLIYEVFANILSHQYMRVDNIIGIVICLYVISAFNNHHIINPKLDV